MGVGGGGGERKQPANQQSSRLNGRSSGERRETKSSGESKQTGRWITFLSYANEPISTMATPTTPRLPLAQTPPSPSSLFAGYIHLGGAFICGSEPGPGRTDAATPSIKGAARPTRPWNSKRITVCLANKNTNEIKHMQVPFVWFHTRFYEAPQVRLHSADLAIVKPMQLTPLITNFIYG